MGRAVGLSRQNTIMRAVAWFANNNENKFEPSIAYTRSRLIGVEWRTHSKLHKQKPMKTKRAYPGKHRVTWTIGHSSCFVSAQAKQQHSFSQTLKKSMHDDTHYMRHSAMSHKKIFIHSIQSKQHDDHTQPIG